MTTPEFVMFHMIRLHFLSGNVEGFQDVVTRFSQQPTGRPDILGVPFTVGS
ncbi:hypothetical protein GCM10010965_32170 [Caldalkalibacillus thermarum]|uniref:hypothetical protein n=1 Tax=Caldalkalibacillus thermarum TaxID=296745 RepID=UPI001665047B|nr:hypothetical protein [Caldalkalibacillus thermarum]GGK36818.1 hypothetical protein GCM10010965_32170 [Caldalkalibacillus thermarum]